MKDNSVQQFNFTKNKVHLSNTGVTYSLMDTKIPKKRIFSIENKEMNGPIECGRLFSDNGNNYLIFDEASDIPDHFQQISNEKFTFVQQNGQIFDLKELDINDFS